MLRNRLLLSENNISSRRDLLRVSLTLDFHGASDYEVSIWCR
jgi:hypothetical protein